MIRNIYCGYHAKCNDGMGAAVMVHKKIGHNVSQYEAIGYGRSPKIKDGIEHVLFVDYCPDESVVKDILNKGMSVFILDHHKTAVSNIEGYCKEIHDNPNFRYYIKQNMCGAKLAFIYSIEAMMKFDTTSNMETYEDDVTHNNVKGIVDSFFSTHEAVSRFYEYLDIRDRWVSYSIDEKRKADYLSYYLTTSDWFNMDPTLASSFVDMLNHNTGNSQLDDWINIGEHLYSFNQLICKDAVNQAQKVDFNLGDNVILKLAIVFTTINVSDAGEIWKKMNPDNPSMFVGALLDIDKGILTLSIRSSDDFNSRLIAEDLHSSGVSYTGGGHDQACGAKIKLSSIENDFDLGWLTNTIITSLSAVKWLK